MEEVDKIFQCERVIPEEDAANEGCMNEITTDEILSAIRSSSSKKSPSPDGLPKEFYLRTFNVIHRELNLILNEAIGSNIPNEFMNGVIVLVKKNAVRGTPLVHTGPSVSSITIIKSYPVF